MSSSAICAAAGADLEAPVVIADDPVAISSETAPAGNRPLLKPVTIRKAHVTHPTGDPDFSVLQAFPAGISAEMADPFLMCDFFGPTKSDGVEQNPDVFPIGWHPHRGMDLLSYMIEGIWVNVPSDRKMDDPRYGQPDDLPLISLKDGKVLARVLAGDLLGRSGPFATVQPVQIVDYVLSAGQSITHTVSDGLDNCLVFVYQGDGEVAGAAAPVHHVVQLSAEDLAARDFTLSSATGFSVMVFAGKRLNQPIAWHGPFVMTTDAEVRQTLQDVRRGAFPPVRTPWDYRRIARFPAEHPAAPKQ